MKKIAGWIRDRIFVQSEKDWQQMSSSIQKMAAESGINRRKNARVLYPASNFSARLPQFFYLGTPQQAIDLSLGGVCLLNSTNQFGTDTGREVTLALSWLGEKRHEIKAKIVGHSFQKAHFQFIDLPTEIYVKMSLNLKSAMIGRKFQKAFLQPNQQLQLEMTELWVGLNGEKIVLGSEPGLVAEVSFSQLQYKFFAHGHIQVFSRNGEGLPLSDGLYSDCLILLCNIPHPSKNLTHLIKLLEQPQGRLQVTG